MYGIYEYNASFKDDIIEMIIKIQREEYGIPITIAGQPDLQDIENFYLKDGSFWASVCGQEIIGTVAVKSLGNGNAMLRKMFVKKEYRGKEKHVSADLLQRLLDWAGNRQIKRIYLGTTPQFLAAHRFYEKNGFKEIGKDELPGNFPVMEVDKKFYCYEME